MRLPPELVLSIHRILDEGQDSVDPLDTLDAEFDPISTLNTLIPDGSSLLFHIPNSHTPQGLIHELPEQALAKLEAVQNKLNDDRIEIQNELDTLIGELQANQDPERMQIIQELISVRSHHCCAFSLHQS